MANREETIGQLRKSFESEWARLFPLTPTPPVRALNSLRDSGDLQSTGGLSFDEWLHSGAVDHLTSAVDTTRQKISQLEGQLARKAYLYEFLLKLLQCVDDTQPHSQLVPVESFSDPSPALDLNVTAIGQGSSGVSAGGAQHHCFASSPHPLTETYRKQKLGEETVERTRRLAQSSQGKNNLEVTVCKNCGKVERADYPAEKFTGGPERKTTFTTGTVKQTTFLSRPPVEDSESVTSSQQEQGKCTLTYNTVYNSKGPTQCVDYQRYKTGEKDSDCVAEVDRNVCGGGGGGVGLEENDTRGQNSRQTVATKVDPNNQPPITTKQEGETPLTAAFNCHEYSSQRGKPPLPVFRSLPRALGTGNHVPAQVDCVTCATQTDISFSVKEQWVGSSTSEDREEDPGTMFWNRKKTGGKRSEESRDRDNSGILGRHSDAPDLPLPPPARCHSPLNVQYLKLTDGFNIVMGSGGQRLTEDSGDCASSGEESYDNNTLKQYPRKFSLEVEGRAGGRQVTSTLESKEGVGGGGGGGGGNASSGRGSFNPVNNSTPSNNSPATPSPLAHAPVSRASSDTTGLRSSPAKHSPPVPPRSSKPLPIPRKKPTPFPSSKAAQPSSVFYVDCVTDEPPSTAATVNSAPCRNEDTTPLPSHKDDKGRVEFSDSSPRTCHPSGRGAALVTGSAPQTVRTQPEKHARALFATQSAGVVTDFVSARAQFAHNLHADRNPRRDFRVPTAAPLQPTSTTTSPVQQGLRQSHREDPAACTAAAQQAADSSNSSSNSSRTNQFPSQRVQSVCGQPENSSQWKEYSEVNQRRRDVSDNADYSADGLHADDMFTLKRHTLSASSEHVAGGSPGVYRKNVPAGPNPENDNNVGGEQHATAPRTASPSPSPSPSGSHPTPAPSFQETDIDAETATAAETDNKPSSLPPPVPPKKRPKQNTYENWTIDRIVTRKVGASSEDDDDDDDYDIIDEDTDSTTPSPENTLTRRDSPTGSKDSGLCLEVQGSAAAPVPAAPGASASTGVPEVTVSQAVVSGGGGRGEGGGLRPLGERISSIDELHQLQIEEDEDEEDYVSLSLRREAEAADQEDNISIASDIVFIPGSRVGSESPDPQRDSTSQLRPHSHCGTLTPLSTSEDEQDSPPSADTSYDDADGLEPAVSNSPRDNMLKMRHLLVTSILETEKNYLEHLDILIHYKRTLEASCQTSQPVISSEEIRAIFSNLQKLQDNHKEFVKGLQDKVDAWAPEQTVGDIFKWLIVMFPDSASYAENYPTAVATIHRCCQESQRFQELAGQIVMTSALGQREKPSLEGALFKPVQRMQRNTLVLFDLIKHTPEDHADHEVLQKALSLSQLNLENFGTDVVPNKVEEKRTLVKSSFLVELVSGWRKLRFIFLFSDLLVCTKMETHRGGKVTFDCKWYIPMSALSLVTKRGYEDDMKFSKKDDIDELKKKLRSLKLELKAETKKEENRDKHWSGIAGIATSRHIEKLKKKIKELERELILSSPKLPFKVWCDSVKPHTLLMTTDYEREEWREVLTSLRRRSIRLETTPPSAYDVQEIVNSVRELPEVNKVGSMLAETDEEAVYGTLNVTIHKLNGLKEACDTYCCLEMDSLGHFFMKARTHICSSSQDPSWNEDFELELEGSQTLRILCYKKLPDKHGDILLGRGALEMSKQWLKGSFQEKTVAMNEYSLVLSVRYTAAEQTMRRTPSKHNHAVFGVRISSCAKREGKTVPTIVTACVQDVEKRGLDEMGIYRVSGTSSEVQKIKKHFDKNVKAGVHSLGELPVHSVTGALKLYLRELPDPLFTEANYTSFIDALKLSDAEGQEKCMLSLLHSLPTTNYYTAVYLLEHLHRVSKFEKENKMSIHNLSTIFGPTLLAPAVKETGATMSELMSIGTEQVMKQSAVVHYFLNYLVKGGNLRKSSQT